MKNVKVYTPPMNYIGQQDDPKKFISNCLFTLGGYDASADRFVSPSDALFSECDFNVIYDAGDTDYSAIHMYPSTRTDCQMQFDRCRFILDESVRINEPSAVCRAVWLEASYHTGSDDNGNVSYKFTDCEDIGEWDDFVNIGQGGTVLIHNSKHAAENIARVVSTAGRPVQLTLSGCATLADTVTSLFNSPAQATQTNAFIKFNDFKLSRFVATGGVVDTYPLVGRYKFPVDAAPVTGFGALRGSVAELNLGALSASGNQINSRSWVAKTSSGTNSTFIMADSTVEIGTSANRPTLTTIDKGYQYIDTTLVAAGKPIWWTGAAWVDSTGASV